MPFLRRLHAGHQPGTARGRRDVPVSSRRCRGRPPHPVERRHAHRHRAPGAAGHHQRGHHQDDGGQGGRDRVRLARGEAGSGGEWVYTTYKARYLLIRRGRD